jgi:hypothetical protein
VSSGSRVPVQVEVERATIPPPQTPHQGDGIARKAALSFHRGHVASPLSRQEVTMIRWKYRYVRLTMMLVTVASFLIASGAGARWK